MNKLSIRKKGKHYWVTGMPRYYVDGKPYTECGPYATKEEANSDKEGMQRTLDTIGWKNEEPPKEANATEGSGSRKVVHTQTFKEIVNAHKVIKPKEKAKPKPVVLEEEFW